MGSTARRLAWPIGSGGGLGELDGHSARALSMWWLGWWGTRRF